MNTHPCRKYRFLIPFAVLGFLALFTFAVYALWNGVVTDVLNVKSITYWQALGLLVLAKILFGGFPGRGGRFGPPWRERWLAKNWASLTPEERERVRQKMGRGCGEWSRSPWTDTPDSSPGESSISPKA
jgi:hypothetical protein